jgi:hypothetical protein
MAIDPNSDERAPGVQVVPSESPPVPTAKDYRDKGYFVPDDIKDDEVPHLVVADQPAEPKAVVAGDAAESEADPDADKAAKRGRPRKDADKHKE